MVNRNGLVWLAFALLVAGCGRGGDPVGRALAWLEQGEIRKATRLLERAGRSDPADASIQANLGIAYWRQSRLDDALVAFTRAAELAPADPRPSEFIGQCKVEQHDWQAARIAFRDALDRDRRSARVCTWLAYVEKQLQNESGARERLMHALTEDPAYAPALYNMAHLLRREALTASDAETVAIAVSTAEKYYERFIAAAEAQGLAPSGRPAKAYGYLKSLQELRERRRPTPAVAPAAAVATTPASKAPANAPTNAPARPPAQARDADTAAKVLKDARDAIQREEFDAALSLLKRGARDYPDDAEMLWTLASLYGENLHHARNHEVVMKSFRKRFPDDPRAKTAVVRTAERPAPGSGASDPVAEKLGRKSRAIDRWAAGLRLHEEKNYPEAEVAYREALELDPESVQAAYNLGLVCKLQGKLEPARNAFERAVAISPDQVEANYMLGVIYRDFHLNGRALEQFNKVLRLKNDYAHAHFLLGLVYREEKRPDMVRFHLQRYLAIEPEGDFARYARTYLDELR